LKSPIRVLISGGGTGGHVFPAIAIANALKRIEPSTVLHFIGAKDRLEMQKVPEAGYTIDGLWISGFQRDHLLKNLLLPLKIVSSLVNASRIITRFKPDVMVGVGGYASGPAMYIAAKMGIPVLIQEQNSFPGMTNKMMVKKADLFCVAYDGMDKFFPKQKIIKT
jgi:UDP-N-acetylglucosamine--N-acetylmuramyl-(pentapeptide) pyrophosphoryl-undecaprenol N-acetylglucosamine transferase